MKLPLILAVLLAVAGVAPGARADSAADEQLLADFNTVIDNGDVAAAKKLVAAPNFRPLMGVSEYGSLSVYENALQAQRPAIARLMMESPRWKEVRWNAKNSAYPLILAAASPKLFQIMKDLARTKGFDINRHEAQDGNFALQYAANNNNMVALKWLATRRNIKLNARDKQGANVLFYAGTPATRYLISLHKVDVNARNVGGVTALHFAVSELQAVKVGVLLGARGIDPNIRDNSDRPRTALDIALSLNYPEIATMLVQNRKVRASPAQRAQIKRLGKFEKLGDRIGD